MYTTPYQNNIHQAINYLPTMNAIQYINQILHLREFPSHFKYMYTRYNLSIT